MWLLCCPSLFCNLCIKSLTWSDREAVMRGSAFCISSTNALTSVLKFTHTKKRYFFLCQKLHIHSLHEGLHCFMKFKIYKLSTASSCSPRDFQGKKKIIEINKEHLGTDESCLGSLQCLSITWDFAWGRCAKILICSSKKAEVSLLEIWAWW